MLIPVNDPSLVPPYIGQRVKAVLRMTPLTLLANLINGLVIVAEFWSNRPAWLLTAWALAVGWTASMGVRSWWRLRQDPARSIGRSPRTLTRAVRNSAAIALVWSVPMLLLFPQAEPAQQTILALIACGMICAGGFALSTLPHAAITYTAIMTVTATVGFLLDPSGRYRILILLLLGYATIVVAAVMVASRNFGARLMSEAKAERQKDTLGLLLRDFEGQSSDWLWEADEQGCLVAPSERLVHLFGLPDHQLVGQPLARLLAQTHARLSGADRAAIVRLAEALQARQAFSDLLVPVTVGDARRWWRLSARPLPGARADHVHWHGVGSDATQVRQAHEKLDYLANFDSLTGLANRHQFHVRIGEILGTQAPTGAMQPPASRRSGACALLLLDLNHFSAVNDTFGHAAGDRLLRVVAERLRGCVGEGELLARLGGDEFALVLDGCTRRERAAEQATRLLGALAEPCGIEGARIDVGISIGIAMAPEDTVDAEQLLSYADMALYAVKTNGRRGMRFFDPSLAASAHQRLSVESQLRGAVQRNELLLFYQPQVDVRSGVVQGFEALLRWRSPVRGMVLPADFIPVAEQTGLILEIGRWVLYQACREAAGWPRPLRIAVNVSAVQFGSPSFVEMVHDALARAGLPAQRLELEITESAILQDPDRARDMLERLRALGVQIALDDFGTGCSSLSHLRQIPLDRLKIDRSFVAALAQHDSPQQRISRAIVSAIFDLSAALDLAVTVEGVETSAQAAALRDRPAVSGQGYLWARPMAANDVRDFLRSRTHCTEPA